MLTSSQRVKNWRLSTKDKIVSAMGGKCQICGYDKCHRALEFHHIDPSEKDFSFGKIMSTPTKLFNILNELEKCIQLCANCHREVHAGTTNLPKTFEKLDRSLFNISSKTERALIKEPKLNECPICNTLKSITSAYCSAKCSSHMKRKVDWDKLDLIDLVENQKIPMTTLGKQLGVSDNSVRKQYKNN